MAIKRARLRLRDQHNYEWYDVCRHPTFVRDATNTKWLPLDPGKFFFNEPSYTPDWHLIVCEFDPEFDNPCDDQLDPEPGGGDCLGDPSDESAGSGNGVGSNGEDFDPLTGWPAGYDLPDSGMRGFGTVPDPSSPSGMSIYRPGTGNTYQYAYGAMSGDGTGTWDRPTTPLNGTTTPGGTIQEIVIEVPYDKPCVPIYYNNSTGSSSIDVYCENSDYPGERVATTCGPAYGSGVIWACCKGKMLIRINNPDPGNSNDIHIGAPELEPGDDIIITEPEGGGEIIDIDDNIGTPLVPYPCGSTVPTCDCLENAYTHYSGKESGWRAISYSHMPPGMYVDIIYEGRIIATTRNNPEPDHLVFWFEYNLSPLVIVKIEGQYLAGWEYTFYCEWDEDGDGNGSEQLPAQCPTHFYALGCSHHTAWYEFDVEPDPGLIVIDFMPMGSGAVMEVYDRHGVLIESQGNQNPYRFMIFKSQQEHGDSRDLIQIKVLCQIGEYYEYTVYCPIETLDIEVPDVVKPFDPSKAHP